jgi:hypothetical protein
LPGKSERAAVRVAKYRLAVVTARESPRLPGTAPGAKKKRIQPENYGYP